MSADRGVTIPENFCNQEMVSMMHSMTRLRQGILGVSGGIFLLGMFNIIQSILFENENVFYSYITPPITIIAALVIILLVYSEIKTSRKLYNKICPKEKTGFNLAD